MKRCLLVGLTSAVLGLAVCGFASAQEPANKEPANKRDVSKVRVGTYDSRAVAMAHFGKMIKDGWLKNLYRSHAEAKAAGDEKLAKELEAKAVSQQERFHRQVFGAAPVSDALEKIEKDIPKVAASAEVDVIVCIHDVVYRSPSAEFLDLTKQMVQLFDPDEETLEKIQAVLKHPPASHEVIEHMQSRPPGKKRVGQNE